MKHKDLSLTPPALSAPAFAILLALRGGDKHGYAILREVNAAAPLRLLPGTLYNLIKRMLEDGWIEELEERPDPELGEDERRRYYRLTRLGSQVATREAQRLVELVELARRSGALPGEAA